MFTRLKNRVAASLGPNVIFLGLVSFFNDMASEMVYPLLPVFFTGLAGPALAAFYLGLMDSLAEAASAAAKVLSGRLSDRLDARKPLAVGGYLLAVLARPLTGLATASWQVVAIRFVDRLGKGLRTPARDALLSHSAPARFRGLAFSFHRMMDHAGAMAGPLAAALLLWAFSGQAVFWGAGAAQVPPVLMQGLRLVFWASLVPGLAACLLIGLMVRERRPGREPDGGHVSSAPAEKAVARRFRLLLAAAGLFTLGNSSDLFLLLFAQTRLGLGPGHLILLWVGLHAFKTVLSPLGGRLADTLGRGPAITAGWLVYALVYALFPFVTQAGWLWTLIGLYGGYYALSEGAERALVADLVPPETRGRAYGLYHGVVGLAGLPASLAFGLVWTAVSPRAAFFAGAGLALAALAVLRLATRGLAGVRSV